MKKIRKKTLAVIICVGICVCLSVVSIYKNKKINTIAISNISYDQLTKEEKIEDFNYLYKILKENYPYFEVNKRMNGIHWLSEKENYEKQIACTKNNTEFITALNKILLQLHNGHTDIISDKFYRICIKSLSQNDSMKEYTKVLNKQEVKKRYKYDGDVDNLKTAETSLSNDKPCYSTKILIKDKAAYININVLDALRIEKDKKGIYDFFNSVKDYPKLIIDIRGNSGGSECYWKNNIVQPLISDKLSVEDYVLIKGGDYSMPFLKEKDINLKYVSNIDKNIIRNFPPEASKFKYYFVADRTVEPCNSLNYKGKIYLLVDRQVYSSSEAFAVFSKATGFAKLIGERTGGDGIGFDPVFVSLPNSGIVIRFPLIMGLNPDGSCNAEKMTEPDIAVDAEKTKNFRNDKAIQAALND